MQESIFTVGRLLLSSTGLFSKPAANIGGTFILNVCVQSSECTPGKEAAERKF